VLSPRSTQGDERVEKSDSGWAPGWVIDSSLASELLLAGIDINVPGLDLLVEHPRRSKPKSGADDQLDCVEESLCEPGPKRCI
jgi:hypothetical protein